MSLVPFVCVALPEEWRSSVFTSGIVLESCLGDRLLRALTMASQAQRLLCVAEAALSTCERSVMCRNRKFQLCPCCGKDANVGASALRNLNDRLAIAEFVSERRAGAVVSEL
jgi:hypothetical protein